MTKVLKILSQEPQIKWQCIKKKRHCLTQSTSYKINVNQWPWLRTSKRKTKQFLAKTMNLASLEITVEGLKSVTF